MANKKKIEERLLAQQAAKTERTIRWLGGGVVILVLMGLVWAMSSRQSSNVESLPDDAPQAAYKQYDAYPPMTIDTAKKYFATFKMGNGGEFTIELYADKAPLTVN